VALAWSPPAGSVVARYRVYRDLVLHDSSATTTFTDVGLSPFTRYGYQVSSVDPNGLEGVRTGTLFARTRDATPPPAPGGLTATATSASRIALTWQAANDPETGVSGYVVYRDAAAIDTTRDTTFADTGLTGASTYTYEVSAFNGDSLEGPHSAAASATTLDATPPPAPPELGATAASASEIDLTWGAVSDPESGIQGYRVYRDGGFVATASGTSFPDVGLRANTAYTYTVTAVNGAGLEGPPSPSATATTLADATPPPAPTGLAAIAETSTRIALQWSAVTDPESGIRTYRVYRDGALIDSASVTSLADSGLVPGGTYTYAVAAVNGAGLEGARSNPASATTPSDQDGDLVVHTTTTGSGIPTEFTVQVNKDAYLSTQPIAPTGTVAFNGLLPQEYHVRLINLPGNCTVQDVNARKLTVIAGTTVATTFVVTCQ
jgi:chitodextrinase